MDDVLESDTVAGPVAPLSVTVYGAEVWPAWSVEEPPEIVSFGGGAGDAEATTTSATSMATRSAATDGREPATTARLHVSPTA